MAVPSETIREIRKLHVEAFRDYTKTVILFLNQRKIMAKARSKDPKKYADKIEEAMAYYHKGVLKIKKDLATFEAKVNTTGVSKQCAFFVLNKHRDATKKFQRDATKLHNKMFNYMATRRSRAEPVVPPPDAKVDIWNDSLSATDRFEQPPRVANRSFSRLERISHFPMTSSRRLVTELIYASEFNWMNIMETDVEICKYITMES